MVILFSNENARTQLLEKGYVYTYRKGDKRDTKHQDWANSGYRTSKIADVTKIPLMLLHDFMVERELESFVEGSGFKTVQEWIQAIKDFNRGKIPAYGTLIKVSIRSQQLRKTSQSIEEMEK